MKIRYLVISTALLAYFMVAGCATPLPLCEKFRYRTVMEIHTEEPLFALDQENAIKLAQLMHGLSEGTCRLEKGGDR